MEVTKFVNTDNFTRNFLLRYNEKSKSYNVDIDIYDRYEYAIIPKFFYVGNGGMLIDMTPNLTRLEINNDYEDGTLTIITITITVPTDASLDFITRYKNNRQSLRFFLDINTIAMKDVGLTLVNSKALYACGSAAPIDEFGFQPYNNIPFVITDMVTSLPTHRKGSGTYLSSEAGGLNDSSAMKSDANYSISFDIVSEQALQFLRMPSQSNKILTSVSIQSTLDTMIKDMLSVVNSNLPTYTVSDPSLNVVINQDKLQAYMQPLHKTLTSLFVNLLSADSRDMTFENLLAELEENYGLYVHGYRFFIDGKYMYLMDAQIETISPKTRELYIEILPHTIYRDANRGMYNIKPDIVNASISKTYATTTDTKITAINTEATAREQYGERIICMYNQKQMEVKLPTRLQTNTVAGAMKTKIFHKEKNGAFYETRIISELNDAMGMLKVEVRDINPDFFHIGKHVYLHFYQEAMAMSYNAQYKIVKKYNASNVKVAKKNITILVLRRVVEESMYTKKELEMNTPYSSTSSLETSIAAYGDIALQNKLNASQKQNVSFNNKMIGASLNNTDIVDGFTTAQLENAVATKNGYDVEFSNTISSLTDIRLLNKLTKIMKGEKTTLDVQRFGEDFIELRTKIDETISRKYSDDVVSVSTNTISFVNTTEFKYLISGKTPYVPFSLPDRLFYDDDNTSLETKIMIFSGFQRGMAEGGVGKNDNHVQLHDDIRKYYSTPYLPNGTIGYNAWCAWFVWWVWWKAASKAMPDFIKDITTPNFPWWFGAPSYFTEIMSSNATYGQVITFSDGSKYPVPRYMNKRTTISEICIGDGIAYGHITDYKDHDHSAICYYHDTANKTIYTIEGNMSNNVTMLSMKYSDGSNEVTTLKSHYDAKLKVYAVGNFFSRDVTLQSIDGFDATKIPARVYKSR